MKNKIKSKKSFASSKVLPSCFALESSAFLNLQKDLETRKGEILAFSVKDEMLDNLSNGAYVENGNIGVVPVVGILSPAASFFSFLFGGSSLDLVERDYKNFLEDDNIKAIVFHHDSPGGDVFAVQGLADLIFRNRDKKPVYAFTGTIMASASAWIGAAAEHVFIADENVMTGSIGVYTLHRNEDKFLNGLGIEKKYIKAGKNKTIEMEPLTDEGEGVLQGVVDYAANTFYGDIARFRGVDVESVKSGMGQGGVLIGSQAIEAGLVDGKLSYDGLIEHINSSLDGTVQNDSISTFRGEGGVMDLATLKTKHPDVYALAVQDGEQKATAASAGAIEAAKEQGIKAGKLSGFDEGVRAEGERVKSIEASTSTFAKAHGTLISGLKFDGKSTPGDVALKVMNAENERKKGLVADMDSEAPAPVPPEAGDDEGGAEVNAKTPLSEQWAMSETLQTNFDGNYRLFVRTAKHQLAGRLKNSEATGALLSRENVEAALKEIVNG